MAQQKRKPTTPGDILYEEFLVPLEISQKELSEHIQCDYKVINRIINEKSRVTPEISISLAQALETTPDFWLNAQQAIDLWTSHAKKRNIPSLISKRRRRAGV